MVDLVKEYNMSQFKSIYRHFHNLEKHKEFLKGNNDLLGLFDLKTTLNKERVYKYKRLYKNIGNTDEYITHLPNNNKLHIKMEYSNPFGNSHYARYWIPYLYIAESLGLIEKAKSQIIDVTSGSAGIALAIACKYLNFNAKIIVPELLPKARIQPMIENGAQIIKTNGYIDTCIERLKILYKTEDAFFSNHCEEKADVIVNISRRIIIEYLEDFTPPDYAVIGLGNGTSTYAVFSELEKANAKTKRISYHPRLDKTQIVFGLYGPNVSLRHVEMADKLTDEKFYTNDISNEEVLDYFKNDKEIQSLGLSSIYGISIAFKLAQKVKNKTFLTIGYDRNDRY